MMGSQKIFLSCLTTLILFNVVFFILGYNSSLVSVNGIINIMLILGGVAIAVSVVSLSNSIKWFMAMILAASMFFSVSFMNPVATARLLQPTITVGIGLASNLMNVFDSNINSLSFMPWLFFLVIGLIGLVSGIVAMTSMGD